MVIRRLTEHDVEEFRWLRLRALQEHPEAFGRSFEEGSAEPIERMAARLQSQRDGNFTLGAYESSLVGIVAFVREQGVKTRHKGNIYSVYVAREAQGRGIARALLEQAMAEARTQPGLEQIMLAVVTTNATAARLYQSLGFETYGVEPRALKVGAQYFDEALMVLRLE